MKRIVFGMLLLSASFLSANAQITRFLHKESDGFSWKAVNQRINDGSKPLGFYQICGVEDEYGTTLIPLSRGYSYIVYISSNHYFEVGKNGVGICDRKGKEIIPPTRGYNSVYFIEEKGYNGYYKVKRNNLSGVCDVDGNEIIPPQYSSVIFMSGSFMYESAGGKYVSTGIELDASGHVAGKYNTISNSQNTFKQQNIGISNQNNNSAPPVNTYNTDYNNFNDFNNNSNNNSNTTTRETDSYVTCVYCNGTGKEVIDQSLGMSTYGVETNFVHCSECGKRYDTKSTSHRHQTCSHCHGAGKQRVR